VIITRPIHNSCKYLVSEQIDYLFGRLFGLIRLLLRATGRGG